MQPNDPLETTTVLHVTPPERSFWSKLGGGSLSISIIFHLILLVIAVLLVVKIIPPEKPKVVDFMGKSGGGGSPASESQARKQRVQMMQPNMARVAAVGAMSNMVLPEPEEMSQMTSIGSLSSGGMAGGLGGTGSGGGKGTGTGTGIGSGAFAGMSDGTGTKNPFGGLSLDPRALVGSFYDLKQTSNRKPTGLSDAQVQSTINDFVNRGWRESSLKKFFKAPRKLYQSKLYIPMMEANAAPAAFEVSKEVEPSRWVVVYRGVVTPPVSGKYRFVGAGDDILVVRFNGTNVFDHGYYSGTLPMPISGNIAALKGEADNSQIKRQLRRDYPMDKPLKTYTYDSTKNYNDNIGGLAVGPEFQATAGREYPIEILLSELPGGKFGADLLIEQVGTQYQKAATGSPILPLFRLDNSVPEETKADNAPPYDPNGPVWKVVSGSGFSDI